MGQGHDRPNVKVTDSTAGGVFYLILIQIASRALTFAGNQYVLRYLNPQLLGIAVQLELYSISVLYFSRESVRVALQRQPTGADTERPTEKKTTSTKSTPRRQTQAVVNISYLAVAGGIPLTFVLGWLYYRGQSSNGEVRESPNFGLSLVLYALATLLELCSEPSFVVIQERLLYGARAKSETIAAVCKCTATCLVTLFASRRKLRPSVLPFAIGQTVYAIALVKSYSAIALPLARKDGFSMLPLAIEKTTTYFASRFYRPLVSLVATLYAQSVFKQVLTQGDALILGFLASLEDQGAFALASNYGGLMARLLFQPIEESSRNTFGKLLSGVENDRKLNPPRLQAAIIQLSDMLHLYGVIAIFSSCFLYTVLPLAVKIVVGPSWFTSDLAIILSTYCYYIPFMAYNGILDAFVTSVATPAELRQQSLWMGAFTAGYITAAYILLRVLDLGAQGLVLGNIFNMLLRIGWSSWFVTRYLKRNNASIDVIKDVLPHPGAFFVGIFAAGIIRRADLENRQGIVGLLVVLMECAVGGSIILFLERNFFVGYASSILPERLASIGRSPESQESAKG